MERSPIKLGREQRLKALSCGVHFFLAAALTASRTPGGHAPFALGCMAAVGSGGEALAALLGTLLGAVLFFDFEEALPHLAAAVLIVTAGRAFRGSRLVVSRRMRSMLAATVFLTVGIIYVTQSLSPLEDALNCGVAALLVACSVWFYRPLLQPKQEKLEPEGLLFLGLSLALSLLEVRAAGLSLGRVLMCVLLTITAGSQGVQLATAAGLAAGLLTDFCLGSGGLLFTGAYGLAGFLAGSRGGRRGATALAYLGAVLLAVLPNRHPLAEPLLLEAMFGVGVFLMLPGRLFDGKRVLRETPRETAAMEQLRERLNRMAAALRDLYDSIGRAAPDSTEENPAIVFDRAAEKVCRGCALCDLCWQREYTSTFNALNDATPYLMERGRAMAKDFPGHFASRCIHLPDLLTAINGELSAFLLRRQYRRQLEETRRSARGQYAQLSDLLQSTAAGLEAVTPAFGKIPPERIGAALRPREGEQVCGDTVASFHTGNDMLCLLLADGMGSGEPARKESALTCRLLQQFLEAGIQPEAALKTLNSAMALRGAETGSFTTVDLVTCRISTGETAFYKFGAAPSYIKKGGSVRRVTGGTLPVGLRGAPDVPDVTRLTLSPGSFVVMVSDGVADPGRDEWLQDVLAGWEGEDPQALANLLLRQSVQRQGLQDDCGIQVLYLPETDQTKLV